MNTNMQYMNLNPKILGFGNSRQPTFYHLEGFHFTVGKILGDGSINKKNQLVIDQKQKSYTEWNQQEIRKFGLSTDNAQISQVCRTRKDAKPSQKIELTSYRCYSKALFADFKKTFYVKKTPDDPTYGRSSEMRKSFPPELKTWFTSPYTLAIFYMDDGGIQDNSPFFATGEVSTREVLFLKEIFETNFGLQCTLSKVATTIATKTYIYRGLRLRKESKQRFYDLVYPTIVNVPCMQSKLQFFT